MAKRRCADETFMGNPPAEGRLPAAVLSHVPRQAAVNAVNDFAADVLGEWGEARYWVMNDDRRTWSSNSDRPMTFAALFSHFQGEITIGAEPLRNVIVIDVDLPSVNGAEVDREEKLKIVEAIDLVLDTLDIPRVHFDSRRGVHTWIRCSSTPAPEVTDALRALLEQEPPGLPSNWFEVFPNGRRPFRLPLGFYAGRYRGAVSPRLADPELVQWMASPARACDEHFSAITSAQPRSNETPVGALETSLSVTDAAVGHWCICKRDKYRHGLSRPGERHWTYLMVACEAIVQTPSLTEEQLVQLQLRVPLNGYSNSSEPERLADARSNARSVIRRMAQGSPILTGCAWEPGSGEESPLRETFRKHCSAERASRCPLRTSAWPPRTPYTPTLDASIWRNPHGNDALGLTARCVYEYLVERAHALPNHPVWLTSRYIEVKRPFLTRAAAGLALNRLVQVGLVERVRPQWYALRPPLSGDEINGLERKLGTRRALKAATQRSLTDWAQREKWEARRQG